MTIIARKCVKIVLIGFVFMCAVSKEPVYLQYESCRRQFHYHGVAWVVQGVWDPQFTSVGIPEFGCAIEYLIDDVTKNFFCISAF